MKPISRRLFSAGAGASAVALAFPAPAVRAQTKGTEAKPRLVVVGGGPGGATVARYVAKDSAGAIAVTLVEPKAVFTTCFHSNLYIGGFRPFEDLNHGYGKLEALGVAHVRQSATAVDRDKKEVVLGDGSRLAYDRLLLAPGISLKYDSVPGWSKAAAEIMPHGWTGGPQTELLRRKLDQVPDGGLIVIIAPPNSYRCPPAPYERASLMAHRLKATGRGRAKIIILDAKEKFSKMGLFLPDWESHYPGMIEWLGPDITDGIRSVDPKTSTVVTGFETYSNCALVNVIPAQEAGAIARNAGLADDTGYCPIAAETMASKVEGDIFIVGDSAIAGDMPKSAFAANSQAKVAANQIRAQLTGARAFPARYTNTCWSLIDTDDAVKVGGLYRPVDGRITQTEGFISELDESPDLRRRTQEENMGWYDGIVADIFG